MEENITPKLVELGNRLHSRAGLNYKILKNRTPEWVKVGFNRYFIPYTSIILIACFVLIANYANAAANIAYIESDEIMDLDPTEVASVVNSVAPYTPNYQEDSVSVVLAMKDTDYLGKPIITDTAQTEIAVAEGDRKSSMNYTVLPGDTLSSIGWKYGLKIATIQASNSLSGETIKIGQVLKLPPGDLSPAYLKQLADKKKQVAGATSSGGSGFRRPTSGWHVSQGYGRTSFNPNHTGVDLDSKSGMTIYASSGGKVSIYRGWGGGYGNHIIINHGNGYSTLYGHMSSFSVGSGQTVSAGQVIGKMGSTGWSTGTHLHFEIRKNGSPQNPMGYL